MAQERHVRDGRAQVVAQSRDGQGEPAALAGAASSVGRWGMLARLLADGQRACVFREFDPQTVALAVGGAIEGAVSHWLTHPELDLDAAASELETFTLYAIERPRTRLPAQASSSAPCSVL
ncbi:hypothetical protein [Streptomyces sp. NPDC056949]|uniref:hypothetical protein n=1 Tax=Streptomyces sp. NPDC056949 TaxID=3345976 RepID=UPI00363BB78D